MSIHEMEKEVAFWERTFELAAAQGMSQEAATQFADNALEARRGVRAELLRRIAGELPKPA